MVWEASPPCPVRSAGSAVGCAFCAPFKRVCAGVVHRMRTLHLLQALVWESRHRTLYPGTVLTRYSSRRPSASWVCGPPFRDFESSPRIAAPLIYCEKIYYCWPEDHMLAFFFNNRVIPTRRFNWGAKHEDKIYASRWYPLGGHGGVKFGSMLQQQRRRRRRR